MFLLVGGDSEIGSATFRLLKENGAAVTATTRRAERGAPDRPLLDLAAPLDNWEPPPGTRAACLFAAVARIVACADDPAGSALINVTQTVSLIERLLAGGIHVLFLSTNQVFDGEVANVRPDAPYSPVSEYGRQKALVEATLRTHMERGAPATILRLAKVVSPELRLIHDWVGTLTAGKPIRAFRDMMLAPVPIDMVASAIATLLGDQAKGIYQLSGPRDVSYSEVARFVATFLGRDPALAMETSAREAGMPPGATPRHTTLDSSALRDRYGLEVPGVWQVVSTVVENAREHPGASRQDR